jgi:hypothetical protein
VPFSCFALLDSFSAVPRESGVVFMFCAPRLFFGGTEVVGSLFHVLRSQTRFRPNRGRQVSFSCFALAESFSAVLSASGPVFMFSAPELALGGTEVVESRFHVLCSRTRFRRCRLRRVPFSCFERPDSFSAVPRVSDPVFIFFAYGHVFVGTEGVKSRFHILCPWTRFRRVECVGSRFLVLRAQTHFSRYRGRRVPFSCFALPNSFQRYEGVGSIFHFLRSWTIFRRCLVRRVLFSYFARPDSCSAVPRASGPVFMFCAPGLVFGGTEGIKSLFHVLRSWTRFRRYRGCRVMAIKS